MPAVAGIWRYPVKSMLGEPLTECELGERGLVGDRAFALVDDEDGIVASAKNPRKWGVLMSCRATYEAGVAEITLPDGSTIRSDDHDVDARLSALVGRAVHLRTTAPPERSFEEVWPDIEGLAPEDIITTTNVATEATGERVSRLPLGMLSPDGTFFDVSPVHVLTTGTLRRLQQLAPAATFDVRRYRPNILIDTGDAADFVENDWIGRTMTIADGPRVTISMATMRCVMTTMAQDGLPRDRDTLRAIAANNRVDIPDLGTWACAGVYGDAVKPGTLCIGASIALD